MAGLRMLHLLALSLLGLSFLFFFNDTATTEIYTLSLHDALPIWVLSGGIARAQTFRTISDGLTVGHFVLYPSARDRKSTRLNSSHGYISYAVFCLKKKKEAISDKSRLTEAYPLHGLLRPLSAEAP